MKEGGTEGPLNGPAGSAQVVCRQQEQAPRALARLLDRPAASRHAAAHLGQVVGHPDRSEPHVEVLRTRGCALRSGGDGSASGSRWAHGRTPCQRCQPPPPACSLLPGSPAGRPPRTASNTPRRPVPRQGVFSGHQYTPSGRALLTCRDRPGGGRAGTGGRAGRQHESRGVCRERGQASRSQKQHRNSSKHTAAPRLLSKLVRRDDEARRVQQLPRRLR